jgi:hypothetical protein
MKKFGLLCLAIVLALGSLGVGFALWSDTLYIEGMVCTGEVDVEWTYCGCSDVESKDVGTITCEIDGSDPHILHFTVDNGYPCYEADCEVEFTNVGTVPVIIEDINIIPEDFTNASAYGANDGELYVVYVDGISLQLHPFPDEPHTSASSLRIHVEQMAQEDTCYHFDVEILVVQYNESIYF